MALLSFQTLFETEIGERGWKSLSEASPHDVLQPHREFLTECTEKYYMFSVCECISVPDLFWTNSKLFSMWVRFSILELTMSLLTCSIKTSVWASRTPLWGPGAARTLISPPAPDSSRFLFALSVQDSLLQAQLKHCSVSLNLTKAQLLQVRDSHRSVPVWFFQRNAGRRQCCVEHLRTVI